MTVQRDYSYIGHHAHEVIRNYLEDTVANELLKALARLTAVLDAAWAMVARAREEGNETDALRLAKNAVKETTDIVTHNQSLFDAAYEAAYKQDDNKEQQQLQVNNSKATQEEEDHKRKEPMV
jgi:hypothetical protein